MYICPHMPFPVHFFPLHVAMCSLLHRPGLPACLHCPEWYIALTIEQFGTWALGLATSGFEIQFCHCLAVRPQTSGLTSLNLV